MKRNPICRTEAPTAIIPNCMFRREKNQKIPGPARRRLERRPLPCPLSILGFAKGGQNLRLMGHGSYIAASWVGVVA